ncbi:MAG TPA: hypothetical protein VGB20_02545 [bacterium]
MPTVVDETRCPSCGHPVLNWDIVCPGCDKIPWNTPFGQRVIRDRRWSQTLRTSGPFVVFFVIVAGFMIAGNLNLRRWVDLESERQSLEAVLERVEEFEMSLGVAPPGSPEHARVIAAARAWLEDALPGLLAQLEDPRTSDYQLALIVEAVLQVFSPESGFSSIAAPFRRDVEEAARPLLDARDTARRSAAILILDVLEAAASETPASG